MEYLNFTRFVGALALVLGLIGLMAFLLRRYGVEKGWLMGMRQGGRLKLLDSLYLDARHRVVLIRKDKVEHTIVLSPHSAKLIDTAPAQEGGDDAPAN